MLPRKPPNGCNNRLTDDEVAALQAHKRRSLALARQAFDRMDAEARARGSVLNANRKDPTDASS